MESPIIISFFNHKGGVGKTTSLREFAGILSNEFNKKVLVIDADPQCSLTSAALYNFFLKLGIDLQKKEDKTFDYDALLPEERAERDDDLVQKGEIFYRRDEIYEGKKDKDTVRTIYEFLQPIVNESVDEDTIRSQANKTELINVSGFDNLYVLPGDLDLFSLESDIGNGIKHHKMIPLYKKVPGAISRSIRVLAEENRLKIKFDVVLVDLNPGITSLNQSLLMGSNYYLMPVLPDYYSRRAVLSFTKALYAWDQELAPLRTHTSAPEPNPSLPYFLRDNQSAGNELSDFFKMPEMPYFLGYICQRVKLRAAPGSGKIGKRVPVKVYEAEISKLRQFFNEYLLKVASVTPHFQLPVTPVIPESNSFGIATLRSGGTLSYSTSVTGADSLRASDVKKTADDFRQRFSYILKQLFRNMSTEDIAALNLLNDDKVLLAPSKPSPSNETPNRRRARNPDRIYSATMGSETRQFNPIHNKGDGNCLFHSLQIERETVVNCLRENYDRINKYELVPEIHEAIQATHFALPSPENQQYQNAWNAYLDQSDNYHRFYVTVIKTFVDGGTNIPLELQNPDSEHHNELLRFLEENVRELFVAKFASIQEFADLHKGLSEATKQVTDVLSSQTVIEAYLLKLEQPGFWAGMKIAEQYAHLSGRFNLRVWQADPQGKLAQYETQIPFNNQRPTIDIIYLGGFHFERLELQDELPARTSKRARNAPTVGSSSSHAATTYPG